MAWGQGLAPSAAALAAALRALWSFVFVSDVGIELLQHAADGALVGDAEGAAKGGLDAAIAFGIVEVGDRGADEIAGQVRIRGLPLAVIAVGAEGRGDGIQGAMEDGSMAQAEVAGILVEKQSAGQRCRRSCR